MASILSSLISKASFTAKASYGFPIWRNMKVRSVMVVSPSANTDKPMGITQYTDSEVFQKLQQQDIRSTKIIMPPSIKIEAIAPDLSTLEAIVAAFADTQLTIDVTTKGVVSSSMVVTELAVEQSPDSLSAALVTITLDQAIPPVINPFTPAQPADADSIGARVQSLVPTSLSISSIASKVISLF